MEINSETQILGIIGHPIEHSLSPTMHNAVFEKLNLNCVYLAFDVEKRKLGTTIDAFKALNFLGLNVTIPHKISVIKFLDKISREVELVGAVNTIKFEKGKAFGFNTDGIGCVKALEEEGIRIRNKRILILGAGGAARAIAFQCVLGGADISISNREMERYMAVKLSEDIKEKLGKDIEVVNFSDESIGDKLNWVDILINTTPVGMFPNINESIIPTEIIPKEVTVMDIVYNPIKTKLLKDAKKKGCRTVDGVGMLVNQGAESLRIWLGIKAPIDIMKKAVIRSLSTIEKQ